MNQIQYFDGYKDTNIIMTNEGKHWGFFEENPQVQTYVAKLLTTNVSRNHPIGRHTWYVKEPSCKNVQELQTMTLSVCDFGKQFTCKSGHCVDLNQR